MAYSSPDFYLLNAGMIIKSDDNTSDDKSKTNYKKVVAEMTTGKLNELNNYIN